MAAHAAPPEQSALLLAAKTGQTALLTRLLAQGEDVNVRSFGSNPLHWASYEGHAGCVEALLKADGIDINSKESEHRTPLALAARKGHKECLQLLLAAGADIDTKNKWEETPLSKAAAYNHIGCVQLLLDHGADPNCVDLWLETPLYKATVKGHVECMRILLEGGADVNRANELCLTPLHAAVMGGWLECVELLLAHGADPEAMDGEGRTPGHIAKEYSFDDLIDILNKAVREKRLEELEAKGVNSWTSKEVGEWIESVGYPQYKINFTKNHITGSVLLQKLDMEVLKKELGITSYGARAEILDRIASIPYQRRKRALRPSSGIHNIGDKIVTIDHSELVLFESIGKGYFGEVKRAVWNGTEVAVKIIYRNTYKGDFSMFEKEVIILSHIRHPNVLMILAVTRTPEGNAIITEYMSGGSLHLLVRDCFFTLETQPGLRHKIVSDICKGMAYLHANKPKPLLHRDLTSHNILLDRNLITKVADFGLSHVKQDASNKTYGIGQIPWMAPEVLEGEIYTEKADVYSFGCILYELWTGKEPHASMIDPVAFGEAVKLGYRPDVPACVPLGWHDLIDSCLNQDPALRPHFRDILHLLDSLHDDGGESGPAPDPLGSLGSGQSATVAVGWSGAAHGVEGAIDFSPCYIDEAEHLSGGGGGGGESFSAGSASSGGGAGMAMMVTMMSGASIGSHTSSGYIGDD